MQISKIMIILFSMLSCLGCTANSSGKNQINTHVNVSDDELSSSEDSIVPKDEIQSIVDNMDKKRLAQSLICCGIQSDIVDGATKNFLLENKPGSIILFDRNIKSKLQLKKLIGDINALYYKMGVEKPFIFIDEEGGRVDRLKKIVGKTKSPRYYFNNNKADEYVSRISNILNRFDIHSGLSPVLDTQMDGHNLIIGDRAFSDDYYEVSKFGREVIKGLKENDILAIGKHFPGHGATKIDSHYQLPIIDKKYEELKQKDLLPFEQNLDILDGVMLAHILVPDYSDEPVSISEKWISYLIKDLNYKGMILSDDLTMDALKEYGDLPTLAYKFVSNGGDIALICHKLENIPSVVDKLMTIDSSRLIESNVKLIKYKKQIGLVK